MVVHMEVSRTMISGTGALIQEIARRLEGDGKLSWRWFSSENELVEGLGELEDGSLCLQGF